MKAPHWHAASLQGLDRAGREGEICVRFDDGAILRVSADREPPPVAALPNSDDYHRTAAQGRLPRFDRGPSNGRNRRNSDTRLRSTQCPV